jgi:hypothetical protein
MKNGQVTDVVPAKDEKGIQQMAFRPDRNRVKGHNITQQGLPRIPVFADDVMNEIATGEHTRKDAVVCNADGMPLAPFHQPQGIVNCFPAVQLQDREMRYDITDGGYFL